MAYVAPADIAIAKWHVQAYHRKNTGTAQHSTEPIICNVCSCQLISLDHLD